MGAPTRSDEPDGPFSILGWTLDRTRPHIFVLKGGMVLSKGRSLRVPRKPFPREPRVSWRRELSWRCFDDARSHATARDAIS